MFFLPVEMAEEYLKMGFYLGIGGVVTFKNAKKIKEVVQMAPMERILLETDSPYLDRFRTGENEIHLCICRTLCRRSQNSREFRKKKSLRRQKKMRSDCFEQRKGSDTRGVSSVLFVRINSVWPDKLNRRKRKWLIKQ